MLLKPESVATCTVPESTLSPVYQRKLRLFSLSAPSVMVTCVGRSPFSTEASGAFFDPSNSMTTALSLSITSSVKFTS